MDAKVEALLVETSLRAGTGLVAGAKVSQCKNIGRHTFHDRRFATSTGVVFGFRMEAIAGIILCDRCRTFYIHRMQGFMADAMQKKALEQSHFEVEFDIKCLSLEILFACQCGVLQI